MRLRTKGKAITLRAVTPNAGVAAAYQRRLDALVDAMNKSAYWWISMQYRSTPPTMAMDATPSEMLSKVMAKLARRWIRAFDDAADKIALAFATESKKAAERSMVQALKEAGFTVAFKGTAMTKDAFNSVVAENVGLIKSIPSKQFDAIEGAVQRSVQAGRDLKTLQAELLALGAKSKNRASFIALDQNNKATAAISKARNLSLGLTRAKWKHSRAGNHPRITHQEADGEEYDIAQGCYIDGEYIMPGEKPRCRCVSNTIIPGFED